MGLLCIFLLIKQLSFDNLLMVQEALTVATAGNDGSITAPGHALDSLTNGTEHGEGDCLRYFKCTKYIMQVMLLRKCSYSRKTANLFAVVCVYAGF